MLHLSPFWGSISLTKGIITLVNKLNLFFAHLMKIFFLPTWALDTLALLETLRLCFFCFEGRGEFFFFFCHYVVKEIDPQNGLRCNIAYSYDFFSHNVSSDPIFLESDGCHSGTLGQFEIFKMAATTLVYYAIGKSES